MKAGTTIFLLGALVFIIPFAAFGFYLFYEKRLSLLPVYGVANGKELFHVIPDFELVNQDSDTITITQWDGKIVVADFFFSHCSVVCPKMTRSLQRVQNEFDQQILINSFSVDPERDDARRLKWYAEKFAINTTNWSLLTGDKKDIYKLARNGFMIVATDSDGGEDDFIHSEKLVLIDKHKRIRGYYDGTDDNEVDRLIYDIKKLMHEK